jgi:hypothetical protein
MMVSGCEFDEGDRRHHRHDDGHRHGAHAPIGSAWGQRFGASWPNATTCATVSEYEGDLNINERLVIDLVAACRLVAAKLEGLGPPGQDSR